jgi:hypothetical protein
MAQGRNKHQSRENCARVREIFLRNWDPIGVCGIPEAKNEYDTYADKAYVMLMDDGATAVAYPVVPGSTTSRGSGSGKHAASV